MLKELLTFAQSLRGVDTVSIDVTAFGVRARVQRHNDNQTETLDLFWTKTEVRDVKDEAVLLQDVRRAWDKGRAANTPAHGPRGD